MKKMILLITCVLVACLLFVSCRRSTNTSESTGGKPQSADHADKTDINTAELNSNTEEAKEVVLLDSGYSLSEDGDFVHYGFIVKNEDKKTFYKFYTITVTVYDASGAVLATNDQVMGIIAPEETQAFGSLVSSNGSKVDHVEFEIDTGNPLTLADSYIDSSNLEVTQSADREGDYNNTAFTGKVKNNSSLECESLGVTVILKKDNKVVYGGTTYVSNVKPSKEKAFELSVHHAPEYDTYEIYALHWHF